MKPIYFSKVEFVEILGYGMRKSVMLLDLEKRELSYQVFAPTKREIPMEYYYDEEHIYGSNYSG